MPNSFFRFKQFIIHQDRCAMKVTTDGCLFGAWAAEEVKSEEEKLRVLDIGTGTGLLSLMIAQKNKLNITAVEIDRDAFEQASENINSSPWKENIAIQHADIKDLVLAEPFDLVVSNPPFYENELLSDDAQRNTAHHGSELLIADLLTIIKANLRSGGKFYLLLPYKRRQELVTLFNQQNIAIVKEVLVRQSDEHGYFRLMIAGQFDKKATTITTEMAIRNKEGEYSKEFITLLRDYYLHL